MTKASDEESPLWKTYRKTMESLESKFGDQYKKCHCLPLCSGTTYDETMFYSRFPWVPRAGGEMLVEMNHIFIALLRRSERFYDKVAAQTRKAKGCGEDATNENCFDGKSYFPLKGKDTL